MTHINSAVAHQGVNILAQYLQTMDDIGYVVIDINAKDRDIALKELKAIEETLRVRVLH